MAPQVCTLACTAVMAAMLVTGQAVTPQQIQLVRIVRHLKQRLSSVTDCTCLETIQRDITPRGKSRPRRLDMLRMEVAYVGGKELFGAPGARHFDAGTAWNLVSVGVASSGEFAGIAQSILNAATMEAPREERINGRALLRIDYKVPYLASGLVLADESGRQERVASRGWFWISSDNFDLVQLTQIPEQIPPVLSIAEVQTLVRYGNVRTGAATQLLPQDAEVVLKYRDGNVATNRIEFSQCRRFAAESVISAATTDAIPTPRFAEETPEEIQLPPNLRITVQLRRGLDSRTAAVGDTIEAVVTRDVVHKGKLEVPRGAVLSGRVRRIETHDEPRDYVVVGLEFTEIAFGGKHGRFLAALDDFQRLPGLTWFPPESKVTRQELPSTLIETVRSEAARAVELPGVGTFLAEGTGVQLPAGFGMTWRATDLR